jgi:hypothetical protein
MLAIDTLVRYSLATSLAYVSPDRLAAGQTEYAQRLSPQLLFSEQCTVDELSASCTVFAGVDRPDDCVVAFRGSTALRNYASMFNLRLVPSRIGGEGKVHAGYQEASLRLYERLAPILERRSAAAAGRLVFVGHSYGGGTATMCARLHAAANQGAPGAVSEVVTFAGPRVGDAAFASSFDAALGEQATTNLYHDLDPVLAQNQPLWDALGFVHAGRTAAWSKMPWLACSGPCGNPPHQKPARLRRAALWPREESPDT